MTSLQLSESLPILLRNKMYEHALIWDLVFSGATLTFEVELINIGDSAPTTNVFKEIDADADKMLSREEVSEYLKKQMVSGGRSVVKVHYVTVTAEEGELLQSV